MNILNNNKKRSKNLSDESIENKSNVEKKDEIIDRFLKYVDELNRKELNNGAYQDKEKKEKKIEVTSEQK